MKATLHEVPARKLKVGDKLFDDTASSPLEIRRISMCHDGAVRVFHRLGECRMTGSVMVKVVH